MLTAAHVAGCAPTKVVRAEPATSTAAQLSDDEDWLESMVGASLALFAVELVGVFAGVSLFLPKINALSTLLHFFGFVLTALYLAAHWRVRSFAWIFSFCSVVPAFLEAVAAFAVFKLKIVQYS